MKISSIGYELQIALDVIKETTGVLQDLGDGSCIYLQISLECHMIDVRCYFLVKFCYRNSDVP